MRRVTPAIGLLAQRADAVFCLHFAPFFTATQGFFPRCRARTSSWQRLTRIKGYPHFGMFFYKAYRVF